MIDIRTEELDVAEVYAAVTDPQAGAVDMFVGTIRNSSQDRSVSYLEYEAYKPMAIKELQKIVSRAQEKWPIRRVAVLHRVGKLQIGDIAVIVAVSTPHRKESFEACRYIIDTLKQTVPIWKKEIFDNGEEWVEAHP